MDYAIAIENGNLAGSMTWEPCADLSNNIYLSLAIERGSWWHNPQFGLRKRDRLKNTEATAALIRHDYKEALQWLIDTGRAKSVTVTSERDRSVDLHRLKLRVEVVAANGRTATFEIFREVV